MIDYQALLLDPIYNTLGVPGRVFLADGVTTFDVTVIDKTSGVVVGDQTARVDTLEPACCIRAVEWCGEHGRTFVDFEGGAVAFNGSKWKIEAYPKRPVPSGVKSGEVQLILSNETPYEIEESSS